MRRFAILLAGAILVLGSAIPASAQSLTWIREFGTHQEDEAWDAAATADAVYIVGDTFGTLPRQASAGEDDAFVEARSPTGSVIWTTQFGSSKNDAATGVAVDSTGVYVVGVTSGQLPGGTSHGAYDGFISRYEPSGALDWRRQFGTDRSDSIIQVATDASGVYVAGSTPGSFPGQKNRGGADVFVRKYDTGGNVLWTREFGSTSGDSASGVATGASGVYVSGATYGALPNQHHRGSLNGFVRAYTRAGNAVWTHQFALKGFADTSDVATTSSGIDVAGRTEGSDQIGYAFVLSYTADGSIRWKRLFTSDANFARGDALVADGTGIYVIGLVDGAFPGTTNAGGLDVFLRAFDEAGGVSWTTEFGGADDDIPLYGAGIHGGSVYPVGFTYSTLPGQTYRGNQDAFVAKVD